jgi:hypothetical protein
MKMNAESFVSPHAALHRGADRIPLKGPATHAEKPRAGKSPSQYMAETPGIQGWRRGKQTNETDAACLMGFPVAKMPRQSATVEEEAHAKAGKRTICGKNNTLPRPCAIKEEERRESGSP